MNQLTTTQNNGFNVAPRDMGQAMQLATMIANSQLAPAQFKGKPEDTLIAMMMGNEIGLNPMQAIQNIAVINGRPAIWGDAMLALVQNHPSFGGIEETFDEASMTAKCVVWRKGGTKHTQHFSQADAQTAGLWGKNTWKQYPKRMLAMRARGFALRNQFADALLGLITAEEAQDMPVNASTGTGAESNDRSLITKEQVEAINKLAAETNANMGKFCEFFAIGAIEGLPADKYDQAVSMLKAKAHKADAA
ncbi:MULTISPECIES: hypothetical protein [unclassified Methylophaga]|uniref:hypothetical protein n=1 Tax=unclassified Methylophaga TaxID=2629249 RepID=UPI00259CDBDE|nr:MULTISPECIES: hypothetical protein [unclassified Methylophaga]|tara:strand:+ start:36954 stop:37700 length:747 start_codon:yes stop_codon:yes gene_type:complete